MICLIVNRFYRQIEFGTTAVIALLVDDTLVVANSGNLFNDAESD